MNKLKRVNGSGGWTLDFDLIEDIRDSADTCGYSASLEVVEGVALEVERRVLTTDPSAVVAAALGRAADIAACQCQCLPVSLDKNIRALIDSDHADALKELVQKRVDEQVTSALMRASKVLEQRVNAAKAKMAEAAELGSGSREWLMISSHLSEAHDAVRALITEPARGESDD